MAGATSAFRALEGELFYDKKMVRSLHINMSGSDSRCDVLDALLQQIEYAKSPSHATLKQQDPNYVPPKLNKSNIAAAAVRAANGAAASSSKVTVSHAENDERKRARDNGDDDEDDERDGKKRRAGDGDDMDMDEDDDDEPAPAPGQFDRWNDGNCGDSLDHALP